MKSDESSLDDVAHRFHTTRWTAVLLRGQGQALGDFYRIYWYPLYAYIRRRALILLEHALTVLGCQYTARGKEAVFETLKNFIGIGATAPDASYEAAGQTLGVGVGTVKTLIHRLRKQYMVVVREEIGRTVSEPAEIEGELRALCNALTAFEGRLGYERPKPIRLPQLWPATFQYYKLLSGLLSWRYA